MTDIKKLKVVITFGDPAGIGPEVVLKSLVYYNNDVNVHKSPTRQKNRRVLFLVAGDLSILTKTISRLGLKRFIRITEVSPKDKPLYFGSDYNLNFSSAKHIRCFQILPNTILIDFKNVDKRWFNFGKVNVSCGKASVEYITASVDLIKAGIADALVTSPINKKAVSMSGFNWPGHTEYLAHLTAAKTVCMMLTGGRLKVVLATRHIGLRDVSKKLKARDIYEAIILTEQSLKKYFGIKNPKIAVSALNPHCGEGGLFSDEEKYIIEPAIKKAKLKVSGLIGPLPADSLFYYAYRGKFDAEIVMYHDQGLIPLKMIAKDTAVNITFGLPFVRTSPAHGTGFDIAGKNKANPSSMIEAIKMAIKMASGQA